MAKTRAEKHKASQPGAQRYFPKKKAAVHKVVGPKHKHDPPAQLIPSTKAISHFGVANFRNSKGALVSGEVLFIGPPGIAVPPAGTRLTLLGSAADLAFSAPLGSSNPQLTKQQKQQLRKQQEKAANEAGTGMSEGAPAVDAGKKKKKKKGKAAKPADEQRAHPAPAGPHPQHLRFAELEEPPEGVQKIYANGDSAAEGNKKGRRDEEESKVAEQKLACPTLEQHSAFPAPPERPKTQRAVPISVPPWPLRSSCDAPAQDMQARPGPQHQRQADAYPAPPARPQPDPKASAQSQPAGLISEQAGKDKSWTQQVKQKLPGHQKAKPDAFPPPPARPQSSTEPQQPQVEIDEELALYPPLPSSPPPPLPSSPPPHRPPLPPLQHSGLPLPLGMELPPGLETLPAPRVPPLGMPPLPGTSFSLKPAMPAAKSERKEEPQAQPQHQLSEQATAGAMVLYNARTAAQQEPAREPPVTGLRQLNRDSVQESFPLSSTSGSETSEDEEPLQPQRHALTIKSITVGRGSARSPVIPRRAPAPRGHDSEPEEALPMRRGAPHVVMAFTVDGRRNTAASRAASTAAPPIVRSAWRQPGQQQYTESSSSSDSEAEPAQSAPQAAGISRGGRQGTDESPTAAASAPAGAANAGGSSKQGVLLKRSRHKPLKKRKRWSSEEEATLLEMVNDMNFRRKTLKTRRLELDWERVGKYFGRTANAAQTHYYQCTRRVQRPIVGSKAS